MAETAEKKAKKSKGKGRGEPVQEQTYLGFRFIEYADGWDFQLGKRSSRLSRTMGIFTVVIFSAILIGGMLIPVHVKVPVFGQMEAKDPTIVNSRLQGQATVEVKVNEKVSQGQVLVRVDPKDQSERIEKIKNQISSSEKSVLQAEQEIVTARGRSEQATNRGRSLSDTKANKERELEEQKEQQQLKLRDFEHQKDAVEIACQSARNNIERLEGQIQNQVANLETEIQNLDLRIRQSQLDVDGKRREYESNQRLAEMGSIPRSQADKAKEALDQAELSLQTAKNDLSKTRVTLEGQISTLRNDLSTARLALQREEGQRSKIELDRLSFVAQSNSQLRSIEDAVRDMQFQIESAALDVKTAEGQIASARRSKEIAQLQVEGLQADLAKAESDLAEGRDVVAPFDGYVRELLIQTGQTVQANTALLRIASLELEFVGGIPSRTKERVEAGQPVKIEFEEFQRGGSEDVKHPGEVVLVTGETIKQGPQKFYKVKIKILPPKDEDHADEMPELGYGGSGNVLTQEMPLLKYWVLHKVLKKV